MTIRSSHCRISDVPVALLNELNDAVYGHHLIKNRSQAIRRIFERINLSEALGRGRTVLQHLDGKCQDQRVRLNEDHEEQRNLLAACEQVPVGRVITLILAGIQGRMSEVIGGE